MLKMRDRADLEGTDPLRPPSDPAHDLPPDLPLRPLICPCAPSDSRPPLQRAGGRRRRRRRSWSASSVH
eukprot:1090626-Prorocentrum_minimum.AAC.1